MERIKSPFCTPQRAAGEFFCESDDGRKVELPFNGSGLERIGQYRFYPYTFQEIVDDSPVPTGLQHRLGGTINVAEESLEGGYIVLQGCPTQYTTSLILDYYPGVPLVSVHTGKWHVYLCNQICCYRIAGLDAFHHAICLL
jgi:hypothetical protein